MVVTTDFVVLKGEHKVTERINGAKIGELTNIHVKKRSYKLVRTVGGKGTGAGKFKEGLNGVVAFTVNG